MSDDDNKFLVTFWGVRGSIACPGRDTLKYGGNTSCVEINCGDYNLIFDAGTGLKGLGDKIFGSNLNYDIFMSHTHIDHIAGFPFFKPAYSDKSRLKMWAGHLKQSGRTFKGVMESLMDQPFFPISVDLLSAEIIWTDFEAGETINLSDEITIQTARLNHPDGATAYRVNYDGKSVCYVTDTEHVPDDMDKNILTLIEGADLMIYDCTYTDDEFHKHAGWGHSTWQEGMRLCDAAGVKQLAVFHHDPSHTDSFMDGVAESLAIKRPDGGFVAREGMVVEI